MQLLIDFLRAVEHDPRISIAHIAVYVALLTYAAERGVVTQVIAFSHEMLPLTKLNGFTYRKRLKELHEYGYLRYEPSFNKNRRSKILLTGIRLQNLKSIPS